MKFVSTGVGPNASYGVVTDGHVQWVPDDFRQQFPDLKSAIAGEVLKNAGSAAGASTCIPLDEVAFAPVIPNPGKILCVGMNYMAHIKEMGREPPDHPAMFIRYPDSVVGHGQSTQRPLVSTHYDFEGELAVIIGRAARHVKAADALNYVAGYSCFMDGSVRDYQRHTSQFTAGKNFPSSGGFGPWLVTTDEIPDPGVLQLETRVNGEVMQQGVISDLCIGINALIEYLSSITQLNPGDVIVTGTPSGVGAARKPPRWLVPGDTISVDIDGIGVLELHVIDEVES